MATAHPLTCSSCDAIWHVTGGHYEIMAGSGTMKLMACRDCRDLHSITTSFTPRGERLPPRRLPDEPVSWLKALLGWTPQPRFAKPEYEQPETTTYPLVCPRDASHTLEPWSVGDLCPRCGGGPVEPGDGPPLMMD